MKPGKDPLALASTASRPVHLLNRVLFLLSLIVVLLGNVTAQAFEVRDGDMKAILQTRLDAPVAWRYTPNSEIWIIDVPGLEVLGRTFNRVTQLKEHQYSEPYPRVLTTEELTKYIGAANRTFASFAAGHDLRVSDLVQFFNYAERDKVELFPEEYALRDFLVEQGLMKEWRGFYQAQKPHTMILSIPQVQERRSNEPGVTSNARYAILLHELAHGEFHTNLAYNKYCRAFWEDSLTDTQKDAFRRFLASMRYAVENEELLINEMQAYLMFTPDAGSFSATRLGVTEKALAGMREAFLKGRPPTRLPLNVKAGDAP
ncbi:MAG TPA: hypothetical protein PLR94_01215 [Accumulibacter sp.]|uniref:hypothetical protein n=1 Tax=Accumulibacter sp. TaxID=2053492 RepID=UPI00287A6374|nr:hypothetical protein [Accumulibacter sp.]MDS4056696.1 hypothetical protein [Accumulibacter sp.]HMW63249.1 hypothetical protein [Accumulibacter sp.]HMW79240.1 hypothetical protein [Accumulibacter sp.]HMX67373.1 hypothetical protein [Accumulibacter sp.]HNB68755.1 hypothetical protein [Accumulibacter sp.]